MIPGGTFSKPEEAHLLRMRLEAGGVRAFIQDENLVIRALQIPLADPGSSSASSMPMRFARSRQSSRA